jgi:putative transposase
MALVQGFFRVGGQAACSTILSTLTERARNAMLGTKGMRFPNDVILVCIRWYSAYQLSPRHLEEMMQKRSVFFDHSPINCWPIRFLPLLKKVFRKHKRPVGCSRRMDETYIKPKGAWQHMYRAVCCR